VAHGKLQDWAQLVRLGLLAQQGQVLLAQLVLIQLLPDQQVLQAQLGLDLTERQGRQGQRGQQELPEHPLLVQLDPQAQTRPLPDQQAILGPLGRLSLELLDPQAQTQR